MSENMPSHSFVARYPNYVQDASSTCVCGEIRDSAIHNEDERVKEIRERLARFRNPPKGKRGLCTSSCGDREGRSYRAEYHTAVKGCKWEHHASAIHDFERNAENDIDYLLSLLPAQPAPVDEKEVVRRAKQWLDEYSDGRRVTDSTTVALIADLTAAIRAQQIVSEVSVQPAASTPTDPASSAVSTGLISAQFVNPHLGLSN